MLSPVLSLWMYLFLMFWGKTVGTTLKEWLYSLHSCQSLCKPYRGFLRNIGHKYPWLSSLNVTTLIHVLVKLASSMDRHISYTVVKIMWKYCLHSATPIFPNINTPRYLATLYPKFYAPPPASPILKVLVSDATTWFLHSSWTLVIHLSLILRLCGQVSLVCSLEPNSPFSFPKPSPAWNLLRHYRQ